MADAPSQFVAPVAQVLDGTEHILISQSGNVRQTTLSALQTLTAQPPQNSKSADYTTVLADAGKFILHPVADTNNRTFTIDSNANVPYPVDSVITFINQVNTVTISITSDTLTLMSAGTTGNRSLADNGIAFAIKVAATSWVIYGTGLT